MQELYKNAGFKDFQISSVAGFPWILSTCTCGRFLSKQYPLVVISAFSRWPGEFWKPSPTSELTQSYLSEIFLGERVPVANGIDSDIFAESLNDILKEIGGRQ